MEKTSKTILSLIISCVVTYSLIVPTSHIFGLEDSSAVNGSIDPSGPSQLSSNTEQTSKVNAQDVGTTSGSEPQKVDDANSEKGSSEQSEQTVRDSSVLTILTVLTRHVYPHSQNKQLKLLPVLTTHLREEWGR